jgi:hypothetical protein
VAIDWQQSRRLVIAITCALFAMPSAAQLLPDAPIEEEEVVEDVRYYSVEVVIFEYASNVSAGNEVFDPVEAESPELEAGPDAEAVVPVFGDAPAGPQYADDTGIEFDDFEDAVEEEIVDLTEIPSMTDIRFRLLTEEELTMGDIYEQLTTLGAYRPVLWGGWVQSTHEKSFTPSIRLRTLGMPPLHIDGTLTLYLKNYLHLAVDLTREEHIATFQPVYQMEKPARNNDRSAFEGEPDFNVSDQKTIIYQIQEDRLFNSGQLRYYDHPKFGALARVNRVEIADPSEEEEELPPGRSLLSSSQ